jgi:hypothetical protein
LTGSDLALRGIVGGATGLAFGAFTVASMKALEAIKEGSGFHILVQLTTLAHPIGATGWLTLLGLSLFSIVCGLLTAAVMAARHGEGLVLEEPSPEGDSEL